jgi:hypothetical protein
MNKQDLRVSHKYKLTHDFGLLMYTGKEWVLGGWLYKFSLVSSPMTIWAELEEIDLDMLEEAL